ncbi:MAG: hypothetical protein JWM27_4158 [Gemmatimonadetes bacterium]|nr:hypothetical protein [Gemmatimonadota bacterium]
MRITTPSSHGSSDARPPRPRAAVRALLALLTAAGALCTAAAAAAQGPAQPAGAQDSVYQYPAKFVCGTPDGGPAAPQLLAPGRYFTAINVRNRSADSITIRKRFALALPLERTGKVSPAATAPMGPGQALTIACPDIRDHAGVTGAGLVEGFAVIESPVELDITAVYTAGAGTVTTMDVERCPGTRIGVCAPVQATLNTGAAQWTVVQTPSGPVAPTPVTLVPAPPSVWGTGLSPARWVFSGSTAPGTYVYELRFCLCKAFEAPAITFRMLADDRATVFLNGTQVLQQPAANSVNPNFSTIAGASVAGPFVPGINVLRVVVTNDSNGPTGFVLAGTLSAVRGRCP